MVVVLFPDIKSPSVVFGNILPMSVLRCVVIKLVYTESKNVTLCAIVSYYRRPILKLPINIIALSYFEIFWSNSETKMSINSVGFKVGCR